MQHCLLVLGMHRSGTSAVAGLFHHLGADLGKQLVDPTPDNPKGYFESRSLLGINFNLQYALGQFYYNTAPLPHDWTKLAIARHHLKLIKAMLKAEFLRAPLIALKDPRLCILYPLWKEGLMAQGINCHPVLVLRPPLEVARSLAVREGFSLNRSLRLWIRYVLDAERNTRYGKRMILTYAQALASWPRVARMAEETFDFRFPELDEEGRTAVDAFLAPELNHHAGAILPPDTEERSQALAALAEILFAVLTGTPGGRVGDLPQPAEDPDLIEKISRTFELYQKGRPAAGPVLQP